MAEATQDDALEAFRATVARFCAERTPVSEVRRLLEQARTHDHDVWQAFADQLAITGLHVPESLGGAGFGPVETALALEELGRTLYVGPWFTSTIMAGCALHGATPEAQERWFPGLCDGSTVAALVLDDLQDPARLGSRVRVGADGTLSGTAPLVLGAETASLLLVVAGSEDGISLHAVPAAAPTHRARESLDPTRPLTELTFDATPAECIAQWTPETVQRLWDTLSIFLACELVGAAEALLYGTVDYMGVRMQFGRPIASFQALKHRCADLLMEVELAKALAREGAQTLATDQSPTQIAHMAKAMASDVAMSAARAAIQLRGGIGFTWEEDTHFFFKRIKSSEVLFGTPTEHRDRLVRLLAAQARDAA